MNGKTIQFLSFFTGLFQNVHRNFTAVSDLYMSVSFRYFSTLPACGWPGGGGRGGGCGWVGCRAWSPCRPARRAWGRGRDGTEPGKSCTRISGSLIMYKLNLRDKYARICVILSLLTNKQNIVSYSLFSNKSYSVLFLTMCTTKYSHCWCRIYRNTHQGRLHCRRQFTSCQLSNKTSSSFLPFPIMSPPNMFSPPLDAYYYLRACASLLCVGACQWGLCGGGRRRRCGRVCWRVTRPLTSDTH